MPSYVGSFSATTIENLDIPHLSTETMNREPDLASTVNSEPFNIIHISGHSGIAVDGHTSAGAAVFSISLAPTEVAPGYYTNPIVGVGADGRIFNIVSADPATMNPAKNLGGGAGIFSHYEGPALRFRTVKAGAGITVEETASDIIISSTGALKPGVIGLDITGEAGIVVDGGVVTEIGRVTIALEDSGVAPGIYQHPSLTIDAKGRIIAAQNGSIVDLTAKNVGNGDGHVFAFKSNNELNFRTLKAGRNIVLAETGTTIEISAPSRKGASTYNLTVSFDEKNQPVVEDLPPNWTATSSSSGFVISHDLGEDVVPAAVTVFGRFVDDDFSGLIQTVPANPTTNAYAFATSGAKFMFFNFNPENTATSSGQSAVVTIMV